MTECSIPQFYDYSEPVARKPHVCVECGAAIHKGERHFSYRGSWDGEFSSGRQHLACMSACMLIRDELNDGECIGFGQLMEVWDEFRDISRDNSDEQPWKRLRKLMAEILWRQRRDV